MQTQHGALVGRVQMCFAPCVCTQMQGMVPGMFPPVEMYATMAKMMYQQQVGSVGRSTSTTSIGLRKAERLQALDSLHLHTVFPLA